MPTEETKNQKTKAGGPGFGCAPEDFKKMFEMMGQCCPDQEGSFDCSAMMDGRMKGRMKSMMDMCCGPDPDGENADSEPETDDA